MTAQPLTQEHDEIEGCRDQACTPDPTGKPITLGGLATFVAVPLDDRDKSRALSVRVDNRGGRGFT